MDSYENLDLYQILKMKFEKFKPWNKNKFVDPRNIILVKDHDSKLHAEFYKILHEEFTKFYMKNLQNST